MSSLQPGIVLTKNILGHNLDVDRQKTSQKLEEHFVKKDAGLSR